MNIVIKHIPNSVFEQSKDDTIAANLFNVIGAGVVTKVGSQMTVQTTSSNDQLSSASADDDIEIVDNEVQFVSNGKRHVGDLIEDETSTSKRARLDA